jgi:hypothetical protein
MLTPHLLGHFGGFDTLIRVKNPSSADLLTLGSILDLVPAGWNGVVLGSGMLAPGVNTNFSNATILSVRGPLTHEYLVTHPQSLSYGDPGLLANELPGVVPYTRDIDLGILPHWSDRELDQRREWYGPWNTVRINPRETDPRQVVAQIGRCKKLVTSSLHGLIVADAFGIPRRLEMSKFVLMRPKEGGEFKFRDYHESINMPFVLGEVQKADKNLINDRKDAIYDLFSELRNVFP